MCLVYLISNPSKTNNSSGEFRIYLHLLREHLANYWSRCCFKFSEQMQNGKNIYKFHCRQMSFENNFQNIKISSHKVEYFPLSGIVWVLTHLWQVKCDFNSVHIPPAWNTFKYPSPVGWTEWSRVRQGQSNRKYIVTIQVKSQK